MTATPNAHRSALLASVVLISSCTVIDGSRVYRMAFIGPWEIALILAIVLILFGPKKLPELAKSLGDAIRQYRSASEGAIPPATSGAPPQAWPQTPAYPSQTKSGDALIETAKKLGIQTEGKTIDQISKEITEQASQKKSD